MIVEEFNIHNGLYIFEFNGLETEFHSHPTIEVIAANKGDFTLWIGTSAYHNLQFAIVSANQKHKLSAPDGNLKIIMIEHHNRFVSEGLKMEGIDIKNGIFSCIKPAHEIKQVEILVQSIQNGNAPSAYDSRVAETVEYLNTTDLDYHHMINTLKALTNLSESRLSHLFKSNIGISLKKYLVWTKLKSTIKLHLNDKEDLFSALIKSGFYDQPHFINSFKNMLGVKPSLPYNSRNLQVLSTVAQ